MIKNILFDCSDTLLRFHAKEDLATQLQNAERAERIHNAYFQNEAWNGYDNGELTVEELKAVALPLLDEADRPIANRYLDTFTDHYTPIEGMAELLQELKKKGYPLYLVSDFPPCFQTLWERYDFFKLFDGRAVSYEAKGSKKNLRLFKYLLETHKLDPAECLFIDDLDYLVANAEACGINGHRFVGAAELRFYLKEQSIL